MIDASRFLQDLTGRYAKPYRDALQQLLAHTARGAIEPAKAARAELESVVRETMGAAEVLGARLVLWQASRVQSGAFRADTDGMLAFEAGAPLIPSVTFAEAVEELATRAPVTLRDAAERTARRIAELYSKGRVLAFARAAEEAVTQRVAKLITDAVADGITELEAGRFIAMEANEIQARTSDWTDAYARMAFRTNVNTAVTAGRFRQAQDQDVRAVIPAFRFDAVDDSDTRDNHAAADGIILRVDNPAWNRIAPPLAWNCRCQVSIATAPQLRRAGRLRADGTVIESAVPAGAFPDAGFRHGGRPDLFINGGA